MLIWTGHGILIPLLAAGSAYLGMTLGDRFGLNSIQSLGISLLLAGFFIFLYGRSFGKTQLDPLHDIKRRHTFFFINGTFWGIALLALGALVSVQAWKSDGVGNGEKSPAEIAFDEANATLTSGANGAFSGNSEEAIRLAEAVSLATREVRDAAVRRDDQLNKGGKSKGDLLTYCRLDSNVAVFLMRIPDLRSYTDDAKDFIMQTAWDAAQNAVADLPDPPKEVVVGTRGVVLYDKTWIGNADGEVLKKEDMAMNASNALIEYWEDRPDYSLPTPVLELTSSEGKLFSGSLIQFLDGSFSEAEFKRSDGTVFRIEMSRFSEPDQQLLRQYFDANRE